MSQTFLNAPLVEVPGPAPAPAGFGLYSVAPTLDVSDTGIREGVRWLDNVAGGTASFAVACPNNTGLATDGAPRWVEVPAFGVSAGVGVDHPLGLGLAELQALARTRLALQESQAAEAAYWTGTDSAGNPTGSAALVGAGTTRLAAAAVSLAQGLGLLEEWIGAASGAVGVIHAPRTALGTLNGLHLRGDGGKLRTLVGTLVAAGTGYPGCGPDGVAAPAGTAWLYATGPVQVLRGPVMDWPNDPRHGMDRVTDAAAVHAERYLAVGHDVGAAAVQITLA